MDIKVLGPGCANCVKLDKLVHEATQALGIEASIEKVTDMSGIMAYGVMRTPGLVIDGKVVAYGRVPALAEIKQWLAARS
ncbi:MAG: thioredoxin family protein [Chloroflexota bacterium]